MLTAGKRPVARNKTSTLTSSPNSRYMRLDRSEHLTRQKRRKRNESKSPPLQARNIARDAAADFRGFYPHSAKSYACGRKRGRFGYGHVYSHGSRQEGRSRPSDRP